MMSEKRARNSILMTCHHPDLVSDSSSVMNFCICFSDIIFEGKQWWHHKMTAIFSSYYCSDFTVIVLLCIGSWSSFFHGSTFVFIKTMPSLRCPPRWQLLWLSLSHCLQLHLFQLTFLLYHTWRMMMELGRYELRNFQGQLGLKVPWATLVIEGMLEISPC